jgi:hypothetical protein
MPAQTAGGMSRVSRNVRLATFRGNPEVAMASPDLRVCPNLPCAVRFHFEGRITGAHVGPAS